MKICFILSNVASIDSCNGPSESIRGRCKLYSLLAFKLFNVDAIDFATFKSCTSSIQYYIYLKIYIKMIYFQPRKNCFLLKICFCHRSYRQQSNNHFRNLVFFCLAVY